MRQVTRRAGRSIVGRKVRHRGSCFPRVPITLPEARFSIQPDRLGRHRAPPDGLSHGPPALDSVIAAWRIGTAREARIVFSRGRRDRAPSWRIDATLRHRRCGRPARHGSAACAPVTTGVPTRLRIRGPTCEPHRQKPHRFEASGPGSSGSPIACSDRGLRRRTSSRRRSFAGIRLSSRASRTPRRGWSRRPAGWRSTG